jgi:glycosyltransferase involved in cell wall biosynthesis
MQAIVILWARLARKTICVSLDARTRLARLARVAPGKIPVVPHGVATLDERTPCSTPELEALRKSRYLLYVGQPTAYRRTMELFRAYSALVARGSEVPPLLAAGAARASDIAYERACIRELEPAVRKGRAHLLGQVSHADVLSLMTRAHAFTYPSVHENCPNVVLEALAAGRVGVYADIAPVRELAEEAGIFVPDPHPPKLVEAIERASFDEKRRTRISREALRRAAYFTWDRTAERTAEILGA